MWIKTIQNTASKKIIIKSNTKPKTHGSLTHRTNNVKLTPMLESIHLIECHSVN